MQKICNMLFDGLNEHVLLVKDVISILGDGFKHLCCSFGEIVGTFPFLKVLKTSEGSALQDNLSSRHIGGELQSAIGRSG